MSTESWAIISTPMLVVVSILAAAMFTRSGERNIIDSVTQNEERTRAEDQIEKVELIQDYLKISVRISLAVGILQVGWHAFFQKNSSLMERVQSLLIEWWPNSVEQITRIDEYLSGMYQGAIGMLFLRIIYNAWWILDIDSRLLKTHHENLLATMDKNTRMRKASIERENMRGSEKPDEVKNFGRIAGDINQPDEK